LCSHAALGRTSRAERAGQNEVDCINGAVILSRCGDGKTVVLTEDSLCEAGLEHLDASRELVGWLPSRADEFSVGIAKKEI
jgi:hypothetical protein